MVQKFLENPKLGVCAFDVRNADDYGQVTKPPTAVATTQPSYSTGFNGAGAGVRKEIAKESVSILANFFST